jgi:endogenous inhibitor of DNA gyrase (YacG/DUF329 family)
MPKCPICSKPSVAEYRPFCSTRCKQVDLNRWLSEVYKVPAGTPANDEDDQSSD